MSEWKSPLLRPPEWRKAKPLEDILERMRDLSEDMGVAIAVIFAGVFVVFIVWLGSAP